MNRTDTEKIRKAVRRRYAAAVQGGARSSPERDDCDPESADCCCSPNAAGYSAAEIAHIPQGADMGLGCGNPVHAAGIGKGEVVVDLGSGAGVDCFLAAHRTGPTGRVIGVDMTPEMIEEARDLARRKGAAEVEFRLGEIEALPLPDGIADCVISNCVINLSPAKQTVFEEALRVLRPGGRLAVSDILASTELSREIRNNLEAHAACVAGAATEGRTRKLLRETGFVGIDIDLLEETRSPVREWVDGAGGTESVVSAVILARKPERPEPNGRQPERSEPNGRKPEG